MKFAAARAATRRGSSITILRPASHGSSSSAGGTCVVLPAPGGASSTRRGCAARLSRMRASSSSMGKAGRFTRNSLAAALRLDFAHGIDRHRRQPHPRLLRSRPRCGACARPRGGRGADGDHRRQPRALAAGAEAGPAASGRAVRHGRRASPPCQRVHGRVRCGNARVACAFGSRRRGRVRAGLLPRLLAAARRSGARSRLQLQIAVDIAQAAVPAPARRACRLHGDDEQLRRPPRPGGGALLHRHARGDVRLPRPATGTSASPAGCATSAAASTCASW